jgi:cytochrome c peroxidase
MVRPRLAQLTAVAAALLLGSVLGGLSAVLTREAPQSSMHAAEPPLTDLKAQFRRPATVPFPASNPYSDAKRVLGEMLFHDKRLSADGEFACATCHVRTKGFADGKAHGSGVPGRTLARHTPGLWNLAWGRQFFWDGRARSLEEQASFPIENPDEMAQSLAGLTAKLSADAAYRRAFAAAFPDAPEPTLRHAMAALATYERTLVSPRTRFDEWIEGNAHALTADEIAGFRLFGGKAGCVNCHSGWAFTDSAFYDIGLAGEDRGRGAVLRLPEAEHAFKTPGLRDVARSAPYMHDGSLATLDDVITHYERGIVRRGTLAVDLRREFALSAAERQQLIAFLKSLSSDGDPMPPAKVIPETSEERAPSVPVSTVSQDDKRFHPTHIRLKRGQRLWIVNNDRRTHNIRVFDPKFDFDSGAQEPGETVQIEFPRSGEYLMFCGIHPKMELWIDVLP